MVPALILMELPFGLTTQHVMVGISAIGGPAGIVAAIKAGYKAYRSAVQREAARMEAKRLADQAQKTIAAKDAELAQKDRMIEWLQRQLEDQG